MVHNSNQDIRVVVNYDCQMVSALKNKYFIDHLFILVHTW